MLNLKCNYSLFQLFTAKLCAWRETLWHQEQKLQQSNKYVNNSKALAAQGS
jgi:hypothetical protein